MTTIKIVNSSLFRPKDDQPLAGGVCSKGKNSSACLRTTNHQLQTDKGGEVNLKKTARGFTLVELLVVIAIIAILAAIVVLIINPLELTRRSRDAGRLTDLANLQQAINVAVQEASESGGEILCGVAGTSYTCVGRSNDGSADVRKSDGSGWVKVDLSTQQSVSIPTLPADPTNSATYHYTYCASDTLGNGDVWEINTVLESEQQKTKMANDGGDENATDSTGRYEVGSNLSLITAAGTPCAY